MQEQPCAEEEFTVKDCADQLIRAALILEHLVEKMYGQETRGSELAPVTALAPRRLDRWRKHWGR